MPSADDPGKHAAAPAQDPRPQPSRAPAWLHAGSVALACGLALFLPCTPGAAAPFEQAGTARIEVASTATRQLAHWIVATGNSEELPFIIVDKVNAHMLVFRANGQLLGVAPVLIGLARGDYSVPGIGQRKLSAIRPEERTTPAGRFFSMLGANLHGKQILWVDYEGAVSIHPVIVGQPAERRAQRLASPTPDDNRITYGCINVSPGFFKRVIIPTVLKAGAIVYVLPESRSAASIFGLAQLPAGHDEN